MAERIDDAADSMPADPTATVNRVPYRLEHLTDRRIRTSLTDVPVAVTPEGPEIKREGRSTFTGIVVDLGDKTKTPREYKVLRRDLKLGMAYCYGAEDGYSDYRIGDEVTLTSTEIQGVWSIVGGKSQLILPTMTVRGVGLGPGENVDIKWNTIVQQTGFDETFVLNTTDGEIIIECEDEIQIEILFQAVVTLAQQMERTRLNVVTDLRWDNTTGSIEAEITEVEVSYVGTPSWLSKISSTECSY